jgi:iron(III) transport system ATP-binding protein
VKSVSIAGVAKAFGGPSVLSGVDLEVPSGSFTAILGSSGSGKTTLLRIIAGFERPDAGEVRLGTEVVDDADHGFVPCERRRIGYVPQEGALFPHLSVGRNVAFGLDRGARRGKRVDELLELVGLAGLARRYPHQLSGGQQQRVALARALAPGPEIVLLDEPFSSLDASLRASVRADVHDVLRLAGATSILVTHDQDEALSMADQVAILRGGVIAQINTPSSLYRLPRDAELAQFLGEANLVEGTASGRTVQTGLGELVMGESGVEVAGSDDAGSDDARGDDEGSGGAGMAGASRAGMARASGAGGERGPVRGRVRVMVRPEQLVLGDAGTVGVSSVVRSYEYFGHDAVVRVQPDNGGLPELVVRITGGAPLVPGTRVGVSVHGAVMAWPLDDQAVDENGSVSGPREPGRERITHA